MALNHQDDNPAAPANPQPSRRGRVFALAMLLLLAAAVLWWWHPWQKPITVNQKDGATMVWVPAGKFLMGEAITGEDVQQALQEGRWRHGLNVALKALQGKSASENAPPHTVYLDGYWIYKYEVTVAQYRAFCRATGREMPEKPPWGWQDNHPIMNISWDEATAYAKWAGAVLPTEAQWEKAARGTDARAYPWGNTWDVNKCANGKNSRRPSHGGTWPVGSFPAGASPYDAMDMAGNVWEWCADWYDENYYQTAPSRNPSGPAKGIFRVLRGGSWNNYSFNCHDDLRSYYDPIFQYGGIGFRCVLSSPGPFEP